MTKIAYIGIDQYGQRYDIKKHPRKELLEQLGSTHADKMYVDTIDGDIKHIGYIITGQWITIYELHEWSH
jgi:hypothetical protein